MPVLKNHTNYYVTGFTKKYVGITSHKLSGNHNARNSMGNGGMGMEMVTIIQTRTIEFITGKEFYNEDSSA